MLKVMNDRTEGPAMLGLAVSDEFHG